MATAQSKQIKDSIIVNMHSSNKQILENTNNIDLYKIDYNLNTDYDFYELIFTDSIVFLSQEQLIFNTTTKKDLMNNVAVVNIGKTHFYGLIHDKKNYDGMIQYFATKIPFQQIFNEGKIHAEKISNNLTKEVDVPFCFGFNADGSCVEPKNEIVLFDNKYMKVGCDNCFVGFSGDMFIDLELSFFKVKKVALGFKNMYLKGGLGVELDGSGKYSYNYNKIYKVLDNVHLITIPIGPIKLDIYVDFPIDLYLGASVNAAGQIRLGSNLDINIGGLYIIYENGKFIPVKPSPSLKYEPYFTTKANADTIAEFKISPSISIYDGSIFKFNIIANPEASLDAYASLSNKKACVNGNYEVKLHANGHVLTEQLPDTILYDTGKKPFPEKCYNF